MFTNELNMGLPLQGWVKRNSHVVETHWLSGKENFQGEAVSNEVDSLLGYVRTHHNWFSWEKGNCKQCFLLPNPEAIFIVFIEWE